MQDDIRSHDLEDIIYIFDGVMDIGSLLIAGESDVHLYIKKEVSKLLNLPNINEVISGHLGYVSDNARRDRILNMFKKTVGQISKTE